MRQIEINGVMYEEIQKPTKSENATMLGLLAVMAETYMIAAQGMLGTGRRSKSVPKVHLIEEYKLILQKKSNLTRREREWVISQFKRRFKPVEAPQQG